MNQSSVTQKEWAISCLVGGIVLIGMLTLFPYDFFFWEIVNQLTLQEIIEPLKTPSNFNDIILNLLLFIPFGFGLSSLLDYWRFRFFRAILLIIIASLGLSLTVEILQFFLPGRTSTPIDLFTNTLSGLLGGLIFKNIGQLFLSPIKYFQTQIKLVITTPILTLFFLIYFIFSCGLSIPLQNTDQLWSLENWNSEFPLILGNELTGDRPWAGKIDQFCWIDQEISNPDIKPIFTSENLCDNFSIHETIISHKSGSDSSPTSIDLLSQRLLTTSEFTLAIQLNTAETHQTGPARILSVSKNLFERNLTLGQWRSHLSIRLRTPVTGKNGTRPEFIIPNVFSDLKPHTILLIYNPQQIQVYIDDLNQNYTLKFTPEMTLFWQWSPVEQGSIHLTVWNSLFYKFLYYCFAFVPLGLCFGLILRKRRGTFSFDLLLLSSGVIMPSIIFEILLSLQGMRMISGRNLLLSISITMIACRLNSRIEKNRMKL